MRRSRGLLGACAPLRLACFYRETEKVYENARGALVSAAVKAVEVRERPTDLTIWSMFTPAYVRRIAREHGIESGGRPHVHGHEKNLAVDTPGARRAGSVAARAS